MLLRVPRLGKDESHVVARFALFALLIAASLSAQRGGGVAPVPKVSAPFDITGYWASVVTEDWRYRAFVPPKGDFLGIPLNPEGQKLADAWNPARDEVSGEQCRAYGAPSLMRLPGHIHITWQDDRTLKLEADAGMQTRIFQFGALQGQGGSWQGISQAFWETLPGGRGQAPIVSLRIVTTKLKPGYLRKNGIPYSANATLTEYFDRIDESNGDSYLVVSTTVDDPTYLTQPYLTSVHFKKQPDGSAWSPTACQSR